MVEFGQPCLTCLGLLIQVVGNQIRATAFRSGGVKRGWGSLESKADRYRELAAECAKLAKGVLDDRAKSMLLDMADGWLRLAEWAEKQKRKVAEMIGSEER